MEGRNKAHGQWIGRTSQNKTLNFTGDWRRWRLTLTGTYLDVRVTRAGPNRLVGESVCLPVRGRLGDWRILWKSR